MADKFTIIRLTLKVDMSDNKELSFARAMLQRMHIMYAKARPKSGLIEILNGGKISGLYTGTFKKEPKSKEVVKYTRNPSPNTYKSYKVIEKPKIEFIREQEMQPPEIVEEISRG